MGAKSKSFKYLLSDKSRHSCLPARSFKCSFLIHIGKLQKLIVAIFAERLPHHVCSSGFHITITLYTPTAKEGLYGVCNVPSIDTDSVVQLHQLQYFVLLCSEALFSSCYTPANGRASQEVGHTYDCAQLCVPGQLSLSITHKVGIYFLHRCLHPSLTAEQLHTFKIRETISQTKNVNKNCVHPQVPPSLE